MIVKISVSAYKCCLLNVTFKDNISNANGMEGPDGNFAPIAAGAVSPTFTP